MAQFETEQEEFWAGKFGDEYSDRNVGRSWHAANTALFSQIIARTRGVGSLIEFGANIGLNLRSIEPLLPEAELAGVEINSHAAEALRQWNRCEVIEGSILDLQLSRQYALSLIKGVLIHISPDELSKVYKNLYMASSKYICIVEYYNPSPVAMPYRGHENRLFKRDFAGEFLDAYPDTQLVDYGFCYRRDPNFPQDDVTWFLIEKRWARRSVN